MCIKLSILGVLFRTLKLRVLWLGLMSPNSLAKNTNTFECSSVVQSSNSRSECLDSNPSFQLPVILSKFLHLFESEFSHL